MGMELPTLLAGFTTGASKRVVVAPGRPAFGGGPAAGIEVVLTELPPNFAGGLSALAVVEIGRSLLGI